MLKCEVLFVSGIFDYGKSVSGNYILYKILKNSNIDFKVLPLFNNTIHPIDVNDFLNFQIDKHNSIYDFAERLPDHKILLVSGDDFPPNLIKHICKKYNSKLVVITGTHWMYGNTSPYPELDNDFDGDKVVERLNLYNEIKTYIITGSTHTTNVHLMSKFSNIPYVQIPFPFEEIEIDEHFQRINHKNKKVILWGTTQPSTPRKGKSYFENILEWLYKLIDNPDDIIIQTIGPKSQINTKFKVEYLGEIPNRIELSRVYKSSDVFALTTLADAGPMMATECIRNNTPLVSFSTNIAYDLVNDGKNGYIVNGTEEFAEKLYEILYNKNFHMDLNYIKNFNSEKVVYGKYKEFFQKIINE